MTNSLDQSMRYRSTSILFKMTLPFILPWSRRDLIFQLIKREVLERYRGSILGLVWSFMHPVVMLLVYLFVFSIVFKMRWGLERSNEVGFAVILFSGLVIHGLLAECLVKAPALIVRNPHFVKKIVFPLEILSIASIGAALFHMFVGIAILILANVLLHGSLSWHVLLLPVVVFPLVIVCLGVSWFVASLAVFIRDVNQIVGILAAILLFICPIFYPLSAVPEDLRSFMYLNPLTLIVEQVRMVVLYESVPDWSHLGIYFVAALVFMYFGYWWFDRTRHAFADVI